MKAFPSAEPIYSKDIVGIKESAGMDLRDYFAAKALPIFIEISRENYNNGNATEGGFHWCAEMAYKQANAMLKVRG